MVIPSYTFSRLYWILNKQIPHEMLGRKKFDVDFDRNYIFE